MTLGWALLIIAAVWLIDKHHLWKRVAKIAGVLLVLAGLGISGHILYDRHEAANERTRYEAEAAQMEEEPKVDPIPPGAGDPIPAGAQIEIPCTKWMAQDKNGKCWAERSLDMLNQKEVSTERQHVDCFDPTTGRLDGFPVL